MKTYDIELICSIEDFHIQHEQFETIDGKRLKLLSRSNSTKKFLTINGLLTSTSNPLFTQAPYNSVENRFSFDLTKILFTVQLEAFVSIFQFQKEIFKKIENRSTEKKVEVDKTPSSDSSSFQIDFHLEEISLLIGNNFKQILYVQLKEFAGFFAQTHLKMAARLSLNDFRILDPQKNALFPLIIGKVNSSNDFIQLDLSLFYSSKKLPKTLQEKSSFLHGQIEKVNVVFLYKHLDLLLSLIDVFQTKTTENPPASTVKSDEPTFAASLLQKYQEQSLEFHLNCVVNAPQIFVPINSYSKEGLFIDLGKLTLLTDNRDDENSLAIEEHRIRFENLSICRISFHQSQTIVHRQFVQCSPFVTLIQRYLNPKHEENANKIVIKTQWDTISMKLGKSDFAFIKQILNENFKEKFFFKFPKSPPVTSSSTSSTKQSIPTREKPISFRIRWAFQMKEINFVLYLDEPNVEHPADETSKFLSLTIQTIEANFENSRGSLAIQQFYADDVSKTKSNNSLSRYIDANSPFLRVQFDSFSSIDIQIESFNILISANLINALKEFFLYELPIKRGRKPREILSTKNDFQLSLPSPAKSISQRPMTTTSNDEIEEEKPKEISTQKSSKIDVVLKSSRLILVEDSTNENSNCLTLNIDLKLNFLSSADQTKLSALIDELSFYGANFEQLKQSKWKYSVRKNDDFGISNRQNSSRLGFTTDKYQRDDVDELNRTENRRSTRKSFD